MDSIKQSLQVNFNYEVHFLSDIFNSENQLLASVMREDDNSTRKKTIVVIDDGVLAKHKDLLNKLDVYALKYKDVFAIHGKPIILKGGESVKMITLCTRNFTNILTQKVFAAIHTFLPLVAERYLMWLALPLRQHIEESGLYGYLQRFYHKTTPALALKTGLTFLVKRIL